MRISHFTILILLLLLAVAPPAHAQTFTRSTIGSNFSLATPWDLHYGPDDFLWVTERELGVVLRINPETGDQDILLAIPDVSSTAGQDGLLGMALHDGLLEDDPYVYLSYTHLVQGQRRQKLVRYTYEVNGNNGSLSSPLTLIDNLPSSNDHNSGRMVFGPDEKLFYTIGDQGSNQGGNYCKPILSQVLPTQEEVDAQDWTNYPGKILRLNLDGSIPDDNPELDGVRSHIYSYGHRNAQGIVFAENGLLYSDEHGPNTDDEVNIIYRGDNYGWPNVAGYKDNQVYDYCDWSSAADCQSWNYNIDFCPPGATFMEETEFSAPNYREPLMSMFAVPDDYDFNNPDCQDSWICRPNVAPSSVAVYESDAIPEWKNSVLVSSLKRGRIYRLKLNSDGTEVVGDTTQHFYTQNRYRDIVVSPDGREFYMITDESGKTSGPSGLTVTTDLLNPGTIVKFTLNEVSGTSHQLDDPSFAVWPNPTTDILNITSDLFKESDFTAVLINSTGQVVRSIRNLSEGTNEMHVSNLPAGIYFARVSSQKGSMTQRVIIFN